MPDRQPDKRSLNFAGDVDDQGRPLPMKAEVLRARTEKWPRSPHTPDGVAAQLSRARQMFIDGYYTYENFIDAATRSLQAVEAALRVRLDADAKTSFAQLIDQARNKGLIDDSGHDILHTGRILRTSRSTRPRPPSTTLRSPPASSGPHTSWWPNCSRTGWRHKMDSPEGRADLNAGQHPVSGVSASRPHPSHVAARRLSQELISGPGLSGMSITRTCIARGGTVSCLAVSVR